MAPSTTTAFATEPGNKTLSSATAVPSTLSLTSSGLGNLTSIVFGVIATILGLLTIWKTHRTWHKWYHYHIHIGNNDSTSHIEDGSADWHRLQRRGSSDIGIDGDPVPAADSDGNGGALSPRTPNYVTAESSPMAEFFNVREHLSEQSAADADEASDSPGP